MKLRVFALVRSVGKRSRSDWPLVLSAWLLLVCSTTLIASSVAYSESVASGGFHKVIESAPSSSTSVRVYASASTRDLESADGAIRPVIESALGADRGRISRIVTTDGLSPAGYDASDQAHQIVVGSYGDIETHAKLVGGVWPADGPAATARTGDPCAPGGVETALSVEAAKALGLGLGNRTTLTSKLKPSNQFDVCVVGIFEPDAADRYWLGAGLELTGTQIVGSAVTRGPFVVTGAGLATLAGENKVTAEWRWLPRIEAIDPSDADTIRAGIAGLADRAKAAFPSGFVWAESGLPEMLAAATKSLLVAQSSSLLLFAQFVILAVYAILLVGGMLVERRRPEAALLRSRGASWPHLALLAMGEALLLAVPAVLVAPFAAQGVVRALAVVGPLAGEHVIAAPALDAVTWAAAVAAGIGCVAVLTIPSLPGLGSLSGVRAALSRQLGQTLAQRLGLDLILAALAAVALWQLQSYGSPITTTVRGDLGIDPLLVAAPAIGLLAGALLATRLVPRLGELAEAAFERATGLATAFLARQMGRRPLRYTRITLLLMLAVAMTTFAAAFAATWSDSQAAQAAYQTGADMRVTVANRPVAPAWSLESTYKTIPGVTGVASAGRGKFDVGRDLSGGQLLSLQPGALDNASVGVAGTEGLAGQVSGLRGRNDASLALPGRPTALRVGLAVHLQTQDPAAPDQLIESNATVAVSVVVADDTGTYRMDGESIATPAPGTWSVVPLDAPGASGYRFSGPLRLLGVELLANSSLTTEITGSIDLTGIAVREGAGTDWQAVEQPGAAFPTEPGWAWTEVANGGTRGYAPPPGKPGHVEFGGGEQQALPGFGGPGSTGVLLRFAAGASDTPLAGIVNQPLLDATGARTGDTILISRSGYESRVRIAGVASIFPTLDPAKPFLVLDASALAASDYELNALVNSPKELWLKVAPGHETAVRTTLLSGAYSAASIVSRFDVERAGRADPISLGVIGALFLGSLAAILLAAIGFLVNAAFMARERSGELAILRALGERPATLARMLAVEQTLLLGYGLAGGALLGFVLGWVAIPFAWLTPAGTVPVPAPSIVVPWLELAVLATPVLAALLVGAALLIRSALAGPPAPALRRQDVAP